MQTIEHALCIATVIRAFIGNKNYPLENRKGEKVDRKEGGERKGRRGGWS